MRSVVVVLPASMCAMMPMFLQRSNGTVLGTASIYSFWGSDFVFDLVILLPPVVRKGLVRFRHAMHIFLLLDGSAFAVGGIEQLVGQLVDHSFFATAARITDNPADSQ